MPNTASRRPRRSDTSSSSSKPSALSCVILGLGTRIFAAGCAIEMAVIAFKVKMSAGYSQMELFVLLGIVFFAIALRGGGPYSLDRRIGKEL